MSLPIFHCKTLPWFITAGRSVQSSRPFPPFQNGPDILPCSEAEPNIPIEPAKTKLSSHFILYREAADDAPFVRSLPAISTLLCLLRCSSCAPFYWRAVLARSSEKPEHFAEYLEISVKILYNILIFMNAFRKKLLCQNSLKTSNSA